jgi:hypothetical protein
MRDGPARPHRPVVDRRQKRPRQKTHFVSRFKQITPAQPSLQNILLSFFQKS